MAAAVVPLAGVGVAGCMAGLFAELESIVEAETGHGPKCPEPGDWDGRKFDPNVKRDGLGADLAYFGNLTIERCYGTDYCALAVCSAA